MDLERTGSADRFIGTMAEKLGAVARAATVFGEPVERDGILSFQSLRPDGDSAAVRVSVKMKALAVNKRMERAAAAEYK